LGFRRWFVGLAAVLGLSSTGASGQVFDDSVLPSVSIELDSGDLALILTPGNEGSDVEFMATFSWSSPTLSATVDSVGFRLRGNTSRNARKKSYKVSFNAFRSGGRWEGLEKLNLNGEHNDPSIMRSKLSWDLFEDFGVPASRANHVKLFVNGEYYGLYANVEHVDEQFLRRYFGRAGGGDQGNLYKALWPADLTVRGGDGDAYRPTGEDRRPYDLTQGASDADGYDDLAQLINVINNTSSGGFKGAIERVFDVNGFLKAQAVTALTGSWDSYWFLKNNFYLYNNPATGRWHYIPFDFDNTFGIWWDGISPGIDWTNRDLYAWGNPSESRPLATRILAVPEFRERYTYYLKELLETHFYPATLLAEIDRLKALTEAAAEEDVFRRLDYGFTVADYHDSFTVALAQQSGGQGHVTAGLRPYISLRYQSARAQLDPGAIAPLVSEVLVAPERPGPRDPLRVSARVESRSLAIIEVQYWPDRPEQHSVPMTAVGEFLYEAVVPALEATGTIDLRIRAVDGDGNERLTELLRIGVDAVKPLVFINELMADNQATIADESGEFDDWAEIYNGAVTNISLNGWTMTDNVLEPGKYALPDVLLPSGSHYLVWLDGQPEQGVNHAPFRLSSGGEILALYDADGVEVDFVSFGQLDPDVSWGRSPDGSPLFVGIPSGTPGTSNPLVEAVDDVPGVSTVLAAYPNPFSGSLTISAQGPFEVFDVLGRRVFSGDEVSAVWDASGAAGGVYFVRGTGPRAAALPVIKIR
jgi:spore coat protein H